MGRDPGYPSQSVDRNGCVQCPRLHRIEVRRQHEHSIHRLILDRNVRLIRMWTRRIGDKLAAAPEGLEGRIRVDPIDRGHENVEVWLTLRSWFGPSSKVPDYTRSGEPHAELYVAAIAGRGIVRNVSCQIGAVGGIRWVGRIDVAPVPRRKLVPKTGIKRVRFLKHEVVVHDLDLRAEHHVVESRIVERQVIRRRAAVPGQRTGVDAVGVVQRVGHPPAPTPEVRRTKRLVGDEFRIAVPRSAS